MIEDKKVYLQEIKIDDLDNRVLSWFEDEDLMKFYTNSKIKITKEILINAIETGKNQSSNFTYGIFTIEENKIIGTIKIGPINHVHKTSDLVILIGDRNYLGKGLSPEIIKLGNKLAFEKYNLRKLYGGMYSSNIASIKAYRNAGWIIEGRLKGFYLVNNLNEDRILVSCFNPKYFTLDEINELKANENRYI